MVGSGFPASVPIVGILPMVAGFGLLSWTSSTLNILGAARRIVSDSPLSWGLSFDIASNLHGTDEGNFHHDVVWSGKNMYVFSQKHVWLLWKTYVCFFRNITMFLRTLMICNKHAHIIRMLIVWVYYLNVLSNFLFFFLCYRQYTTILSNEVNFTSKVT